MDDKDEDKSVGALIDELYVLRADRLELSKKVDALKTQEAQLRAKIIAQLRDVDLASGSGQIATGSITTSKEARMLDWNEFWQWAVEHDARDVIQKRVSITAIRERWEAGVEVPGLEAVEVADLSLTKRRKV